MLGFSYLTYTLQFLEIAMSMPVKHSVTEIIRQSPPLDLANSYDPNWVKGRTILITGGASGFGAAFVKRFAQHGAIVIVGDINIAQGQSSVAEVRQETGNGNIHFVRCDVTDWDSQVAFFKEGIRLSPTGGIDTVIPNAGISIEEAIYKQSNAADEPKRPNTKTLEVNLTGVLYTIHLAFFYLSKNPGTMSSQSYATADPAIIKRDRHILFIGSVASIYPLVGGLQYSSSKHGVMGMFRSAVGCSFTAGIRCNIILPYFNETPLFTPAARAVFAGGPMGKVENVVDAAMRFTADTRIVGRAVVVGPKVRVKKGEEGYEFVPQGVDGIETALWEVAAHDYDDTELFTRKLVTLLNAITEARGWIGWGNDMISAIKYGIWGQQSAKKKA